MCNVDLRGVWSLLSQAHDEGRESLYEHECYRMLAMMGCEHAPASRLIAAGSRLTAAELEAIPGDRVVLKVVSPDITHKTEAGGVRFVASELDTVQAEVERMLDEVPLAQAGFLAGRSDDLPEPLQGRDRAALEAGLRERLHGILVTEMVGADAGGLATELFVGIRNTSELGPVITAGLGGVEMELLARSTVPGAAVAIAPTGLIDGAGFLELFRDTLSYQRLAGRTRGGGRLVSDACLLECFQAFIDVANHLSIVNPDAELHLEEMEVNPFVMRDGGIVPLDGVCRFAPATRPAPARPVHKIGKLLRPRSAAVIGVSERSMNMGRIILNNLFKAGFDRSSTHVIRPGCDEIDGARCVATIADLPEKVDLLVLAVGAAQVPDLVGQVIDHDRAHAVILIPGGLGEKEGSEDLARGVEARIRQAHATADGGPVFIGGNSLGVISHPGRYDTMFIPETKLAKSKGDHERRSCFISQSGAFIISNLSRMPWFDPAYALSIGNQTDLTASDYLAYLKNDPTIDVAVIYMEGFQDGDGLELARQVREAVILGKQIVFYKAGRTSEGRSATAGHTASVAGDYAVCEAAMRIAGAHVAANFNELSDLVRLATRLHGKRFGGNRLLAMSNAGFESVGMADSIVQGRARLQLARPEPQTATRLAEILAGHRLDGLVDVKNPFDITPMANDAAYTELVDAILDDPGIDLVVVGIVPLTPALQTLPEGTVRHESITDPASIANTLPELARRRDKPVIGVVDSGQLFDPLAERLEAGGLPVFRSADRAVGVLCRYLHTTLANQVRREGRGGRAS